MAGRRWSSVYTLIVELLRPGGIVSIVGGNIAHTSHSYTDTGISLYTYNTYILDRYYRVMDIDLYMYNLFI